MKRKMYDIPIHNNKFTRTHSPYGLYISPYAIYISYVYDINDKIYY